MSISASRTSIADNGFEVSQFIAGFWRLNSWQMSAQDLLSFIEQCCEIGVSTMDHAMVYRSEKPFGEALALKPALRDKIEIISKCGISPAGFGSLGANKINHYDASPEAIVRSVDASLKDLQTDYLDVLLIHRPDYLLDAEEVADTFQSLKQSGKVKHFGVSNFNVAQFDYLQQAVLANIGEGLVTNQVEFSPYHLQGLEDGTLEQCRLNQATPMFWSCLAGGELMSGESEKSQRLLAALKHVAEELNLNALEPVIYAWILTLPGQSLPILGTSKIDRIKLALQANDIRLTREQWYRIWEASCGHSVA